MQTKKTDIRVKQYHINNTSLINTCKPIKNKYTEKSIYTSC
jgi:hypothetical protein